MRTSIEASQAGECVSASLFRDLTIALLVSSITILVSAACAGSGATSQRPAVTPTVGGDNVSAGDAVQVSVWREDDLSGTFLVDDRGVVTLPLIGQRSVLGMSAEGLRDSLLSDYQRYLQNPSIEVTILRRINILGEVRSPGLYPVDATVTVADAIALAGGLTSSASRSDISLVRSDGTTVKEMDVDAGIGETMIRSGDQIVVGEKSWLARNGGVVVGSLVAAAAIIAAAFINK